MKRIVSLVLTLAMLASVFCVPGFAASSKAAFLATDSFNDSVTNTAPANATAEGKATVKVIEEGKDKAVELGGNESNNGVLYPATTTNNIVSMYADVKVTGEYSRVEFYITDASGARYNLAYLTDEGKLFTADTRISAGFSRGVFNSVQLTYNKKHKRLSLYINGKTLVYSRYMTSAAYDDVAGFGIRCQGTPESSVMVDNVGVFEGALVLKSKDIPKRAFNPEEFVVEGEEEIVAGPTDVGTSVYVNRTFDETDTEPFYGVTPYPYTNEITVEKSIFEDNNYIKINKTTSSEAFIQMGGSTTSKYMVVEADLSTETGVVYGKLMVGRDSKATSMFNNYLLVRAGGAIELPNGTKVGTIRPYEWERIAIAIDYNNKTYKVYNNGELIAEKIPLSVASTTGLPVLRMTFEDGSAKGDLLVDNIKIYDGTEPKVFEEGTSSKKMIYEENSMSQSLLGSMKVIQLNRGSLYSSRTKTFVTEPIELIGDSNAYLAEADLRTLFGADAKLEGSHPTKAGYYDANATAEANKYNKYVYEGRMIIYSPGAIDFSEDNIEVINRYMQFDRPTPEKVRELHDAKIGNQHPRVMITKERIEEIKELYKTDPVMKKWGDNAIAAANKAFSTPEFTYPKTGSSLDDVNLVYPMLVNLGMAYYLTGNHRYAARAWTATKTICELEDWNPLSYLDVGELSAIVGMAYDWFYDAFTDEQKAYIEEKLFEKGLNYQHQLYYGTLDRDEVYWTWWDNKNNWNPVCNGGTMIGAIAVFDKYPEICSEIVAHSMRGMEYPMESYFPEGAWHEGGGYWGYALRYLGNTLLTFDNAFGDDFGFLCSPGLDNTGWFGLNLAASTGNYNFGDVSGGFVNNKLVSWCADVFNDAELLVARLEEMEKNNYVGDGIDMMYYNPHLLEGANVELSLDTSMPSIGLAILRQSWYDRGATAVGIVGMKPSSGHNHHDAGAVIVDMGGERIIHDIGAESYSAPGYFSTLRYHYYRTRPEGHSTWVINPTNDPNDYGGYTPWQKTPMTEITSKDKGAFVTLDLSNVYQRDTVSAQRAIKLDGDRRVVTVRDEIEFRGDAEFYSFLQTSTAAIEMQDANTAIITTQTGNKYKIQVATNARSFTFGGVDAKNLPTSPQPEGATNDVVLGKKKLQFYTKTSGKLWVTFKITTLDDPEADKLPDTTPIAEWTIPDGEVSVLPELDMIYANGEPLDKFDPQVTAYASRISKKEVPIITAESSDGRVEIVQSKEFGKETTVRVYSAADESLYRTYRVLYTVLPPLEDINGLKRFPVKEVTASQTDQEENGPTNVIDQDLATRWAAESETGAWIQLELEEVQTITSIGVSWHSGNARVTTFKIEVSLDGENWTEVFYGGASGTTTDIEFYPVPSLKAKYARVTGYGNSKNHWNSVTEFAVLG